MKRLFTINFALFFCLLLSVKCYGQDNFTTPPHTLSFHQISKEWKNYVFFLPAGTEKHDIFTFFIALTEAYPNEVFFRALDKHLNFDTNGWLSHYVLDIPNGYMACSAASELSPGFEMCCWKKTNGDHLYAVSFIGYRYLDESEMTGNRRDESISDLLFFELKKGARRFVPIAPETVLGQTYDFKKYRVRLPRHGKDIKLMDENNTRLLKTLKWERNSFK